MALRFSMILEAIDRVTGPAKRIRASNNRIAQGVRRMAQDMRKARRDVESGARSLEHFQRRAQRLRRVALGRTFQAAANSARRLGRNLRDLPRRLRLVERAGKAAGRGLRWMGGKALGMAKWGLAAGAAAGGFAIFDLFRTAGQFEQFQVMLEGIEGSSEAARQSMRWVQDFAQTTPYELDQVMEAFVALKAYGIDPTNGSLRSLGDGASGMSKDLMQAVEALADAMTGEFERLKEFGIRASKQGDRVVFTYRQNGKDLRREAAMTGTAIEEALVGIFDERFGGGMERQSRTLFGILSNIKDLWSRFLIMVADAGIFDRVKTKLDEWRQRLDALAKDGTLQEWATKISKALETAFEWAIEFVSDEDRLRKMAEVIRTIGEALYHVARAINAVVNAWNKYAPLRDAASRVSDNLTPGARLVPAARRFIESMTDSGDEPPPAATSPFGRGIAQATRSGQASIERQQVEVGGKAQVEISLAPELRSRVRGMSSVNPLIPFELQTGRTMRAGS